MPRKHGIEEIGKLAVDGKALSTEKRGRGRPTLYHPGICEQVYEYGLLGLTAAEIARELGIAETHLYVWKKAHPEFAEALRRARVPSDAKVAQSLFERATGYRYTEQEVVKVRTTTYSGKDRIVTEEIRIIEVERFMPPDVTAQSMWLRNRQPERWRDTRKMDIQGTLEHRLAAMNPEERAAWSADLVARANALLKARVIEHEPPEVLEDTTRE